MSDNALLERMRANPRANWSIAAIKPVYIRALVALVDSSRSGAEGS
jgi:hypothetical protein